MCVNKLDDYSTQTAEHLQTCKNKLHWREIFFRPRVFVKYFSHTLYLHWFGQACVLEYCEEAMYGYDKYINVTGENPKTMFFGNIISF